MTRSYADNNSEVDKEIRETKEKINNREGRLRIMGEILRGVHDIKYRIFVMKYLDNISSREIARRLNYSRRRIDQLLEVIEFNLK